MPLVPGMLAIGPAPGGGLHALGDAAGARACFCVDRRGTWLVVGEGMRGVHVNGRPVQRKAMLRGGDNVHVDGVELTLVSAAAGPAAVPARAPAGGDDGKPDPRILLRGTTWPHHGRSLTLDHPRRIGSADDADIRIDGAPSRLAQVSLEGGQAVLRMEGDADVRVNGVRCRSAVLQPGDQVAFDANHRFVLEAPMPVLGATPVAETLPETQSPAARPETTRLRIPWLLVAALLLAAALSALLLL